MEEKIVFSIAEKILSLKPNGTTVVLYEFSDNTAEGFIDFFLPCLLGIKSWNDMSVQLSIGGFLGDLSQYDTNLFSDSPKSVPGLSNPKDILSLFTLRLSS